MNGPLLFALLGRSRSRSAMMGVPTRMVLAHSLSPLSRIRRFLLLLSFVLSLCGRQLICTMVAGFTIVNYTNAGKQFHEAIDFHGAHLPALFLYTRLDGRGNLARNLPLASIL